jgi:hypothetical protein
MKLTPILAGLLVASSLTQAQVFTFTAPLSGPAEATPNNSPGIGFATVTYNSEGRTLQVDVSFSGLTGNTTAAHIHAPTALPFAGAVGVAVSPTTFPSFPLGVKSGAYSHLFDLTLASTYTTTFVNNFGGGTVAGAEAALFDSFKAGTAYVNVHSTTFGGGEIRGFLTAVPEPGETCALGAVVLGTFAVVRRWRRA